MEIKGQRRKCQLHAYLQLIVALWGMGMGEVRLTAKKVCFGCIR